MTTTNVSFRKSKKVRFKDNVHFKKFYREDPPITVTNGKNYKMISYFLWVLALIIIVLVFFYLIRYFTRNLVST